MSSKDTRQEMRRLRQLGWRVTREGKHMQLRHPDHGVITVGRSVSDHRAQENLRRDVARLMGISTAELKVRMGLRQEQRSPGDRRRKGHSIQRDDELLVLERHRAKARAESRKAAEAQREATPPPPPPLLLPEPVLTAAPEPEPEPEVKRTRRGEVWDRKCLWCQAPLDAPTTRGRPPVTCRGTDHGKRLETLRTWASPIKLDTMEQVARMRSIRQAMQHRKKNTRGS